MPDTEFNRVLATDCGSTTTKAILIERREDGYRLVARGEAPTTVEAPYEDVTRGVLNAVNELQDLTGLALLDGDDIIRPAEKDRGVDMYLSTSSAGGGLQIMVVGLVRRMTAESAERAALGAGAIVMDVLALDDGREPHERIERMRRLRPDMILISGGVDGGEQRRVVEMTELVAAANPTARLGAKYRLPIIFAGNTDARAAIQETLAEVAELTITENLRPTMEQENLGPTRLVIQDLFLHHVMAQAPGYSRLVPWTDADIMPTPAAVGSLLQALAQEDGINAVGVDIGGATTDVFSVFDGRFNRTVSANLGMSYSVSNVMTEAGIDNILRWVPLEMDRGWITNQIRNKMIRPTTIPQTLPGLQVEQALAREALRLAFIQHASLATGLKGVQTRRDISDAFTQRVSGESIINMMALDRIIGSGGVLSHAPRRNQAAMMLIDAYEPQGFTELGVDSIFMMPHLGVLATVNRAAASEVFFRDCLIPLGTCIAPVGRYRDSTRCMSVECDLPGFGSGPLEVAWGDIKLFELPAGQSVTVSVTPAPGVDVGAGPGKAVSREVVGGDAGLIIDARGRPIVFPDDPAERRARVGAWQSALHAYPEGDAG